MAATLYFPCSKGCRIVLSLLNRLTSPNQNESMNLRSALRRAMLTVIYFIYYILACSFRRKNVHYPRKSLYNRLEV